MYRMQISLQGYKALTSRLSTAQANLTLTLPPKSSVPTPAQLRLHTQPLPREVTMAVGRTSLLIMLMVRPPASCQQARTLVAAAICIVENLSKQTTVMNLVHHETDAVIAGLCRL